MQLVRIGVFLCCLLCTMHSSASRGDETRLQIKAFENGLISRWEFGKDSPQRHNIAARLKAHKVPGVSVAIIRDGNIIHARGYGTRQVGKDAPVDANTLFSVGSVSKMVNAALILKLVEEKQLDLDTDVNQYLRGWKVPENRYTKKKAVTLRTILSHTAGFNVHGFPDFEPGAQLPSVLDTLNGRAPARHRAVKVTFLPGSAMDYSGGGITVSQLVATDKTGLNYPELARRVILSQLEMIRSTFQNPLPAAIKNVAHAHDKDGDAATRERGWEAMPEMAASGLWTNASDLAKFVIALTQSYRNENGFIKHKLAQDMMNREKTAGMDWGPELMAAEILWFSITAVPITVIAPGLKAI